MENMQKGLTVPKWVLINQPKIPQMPQNLSDKIVCPSPKVWNFDDKRFYWASIVRVLCHSFMKECDGESVLSIIIVLFIYLGFIAQYYTFWKTYLPIFYQKSCKNIGGISPGKKPSYLLLQGPLKKWTEHSTLTLMSQRKTIWGLFSWKITQKYCVKTRFGN